eukprot:m.128939 g.128939  ORF g.128939 m.128939 type:complete len:217 (-) comp17450_c0_seq16:253-903(-)
MEAGEENPDRFLEAVMSGDVPKVCEMINAGADVNLPVNQVGHKPTHHAAMAGDPDMLDALVSAGGDVNDVGELSGSVLQFACQHYEFVPEAALKMVTTLTRDNKIHHRTVLGSALAYASALGMVPIVKLLLNAGADPNYFPDSDDYAMTPLVLLIFENMQMDGHAEVARMLLNHGARALHIARSGTPLHYAKEYGRDDLIPILRDAETAEREQAGN